jgi:hypothetical protein
MKKTEPPSVVDSFQGQSIYRLAFPVEPKSGVLGCAKTTLEYSR